MVTRKDSKGLNKNEIETSQKVAVSLLTPFPLIFFSVLKCVAVVCVLKIRKRILTKSVYNFYKNCRMQNSSIRRASPQKTKEVGWTGPNTLELTRMAR